MQHAPHLADRVACALAMSSLGDAMGLPHEGRGLRGDICEDADTLDPFDLPIADTFRGDAPDPWNIWAPTQFTAGRRGVISDDTAIRIALIEPWVADGLARGQSPDQLHENDWLDWLTHRRDPEPQAWCEAMVREHAQQWPAMYAAADADANGMPPACDAIPCFYRPGVPVCFGYFLFGELALLFADQPSIEIFDHFATFCRLDQGPAKTMTGVVAALIARAPSQKPFDACWRQTIGDLHAAGRLHDTLFHNVFERPRQLGEASRKLGPADFLRAIQSEIYDHPTFAPTHDLKPFDPTLQLAQLSAYVAYADHDAATAMKLTALGPGDTDTLGATLGLILGSKLGLANIQRGPFGSAANDVDHTTAALFGPTARQRAEKILGRNPGSPGYA